ncbi:MAG TPA: pyridoxal phosphate-dependent aminotransferase [Candidatus Omnitrophota bacterium]|nr:pyridoxal phosphate-dependent aminotransferase [Candidatus Omnitrophota bacterium]
MDINRRIKSLVGSSTLAITARAKELCAQGQDVVSFAGGEPDFDTPPEIKQAAIRAIEDGYTKYTPSVGSLELRQLISKKFARENNLAYTPEQIVVSCGAKHSLYNVIQVLADDGDEVLIPSPYWVSYPEMVKVSGATSRFIPTTAESHFKINAAMLKQHITKQTKILILNSPSNPTGMVYSLEELRPIAELCVKNRIWIISDEIYEKLIYESSTCPSIAALGPEAYAKTITVNGFSKAFSMTGWRVGYCAGPQEIMDYVKKFQDHSTSNPSSISQKAALQALSSSEESILAMREEFKQRRDLLMSLMDKIPGITYIKPEGAFYLFCDFSALGDSQDVARRILNDVNVALIPGDGFGAPGFMRLSFSTSKERIQEGVKRLAGWIAKNR